MPLIVNDTLPTSSVSHSYTNDKKDRRQIHNDADVVVIGGGVVGSALAVSLGDQGRSVILLEKSLKQPDRIVGELLQPGGVQALQKLGLGHCLEDIDAIPVLGYLVTYHAQPVEIPYPQDAGKGNGSRVEGRSFHHGRFVQALRMAAMQHKNVTVVEGTAKELIKYEWTGQILGVKTKANGFYFGSLTIVCDGCASRFRKDYIQRTPITSSKFYGVEMKDAVLPAPYHGHVILGDSSPILLYQIGTHETRALIDVQDGCPTAHLSAGGIKNHFEKVVVPALPECVRPAFIDAVKNWSIRSMQNSWLPPTVNKTPGMIIIGDALNMRHPLTGDGMTVGLNDVVLLADLLGPDKVPSLSDTKAVKKQMRLFHWRRKDVTSVINILAQALYVLFATADPNLKALQIGCFRYFQLGIDGPSGLLAGIIRNRLVLVYHFFCIAFLAIWVKARSCPMLIQPFILIFRGVSIFATAVNVIGRYIFAELRT